MTESAKIIPFRGHKPAQRPAAGLSQHPLPWRHENGFVWDANNRLVGSTLANEAAEWVTRVVNTQQEEAGE